MCHTRHLYRSSFHVVSIEFVKMFGQGKWHNFSPKSVKSWFRIPFLIYARSSYNGNGNILFQICAVNGNGGLMEIRTDGNYGAGQNPSSWTGSGTTLEHYMKGNSNGDHVKYGQCWVAAGLVTTCEKTTT